MLKMKKQSHTHVSCKQPNEHICTMYRNHQQTILSQSRMEDTQTVRLDVKYNILFLEGYENVPSIYGKLRFNSDLQSVFAINILLYQLITIRYTWED